MVINIPTTKQNIFKQYLHILNPVLGKNKLTPTEIEVMSKFLLIQSLYPHLTEEQLGLIALHPQTRKKIRVSIKEESKLEISANTFNNILLTLRKKQFIEKSLIKHKPMINKDGNITITFNLNL